MLSEIPESLLLAWLKLMMDVFLAAAAAVGFVWKLIKQPIDTEINGLGERLNKSEHIVTAVETRVESNERTLIESANDRKQLFLATGKLDTALSKLIDELSQSRNSIMTHVTHRSELTIGEVHKLENRIVALETKQRHIDRHGG